MTNSTSTIVRLAQGDIRVRVEGDPARPAVLFAHGFMATGRLWEGVADALRDTHRVVVPDLPLGAHTIPVAPDADLTPQGVARLLGDLADALDLHDVTLVGNDSGGAICQFAIDARPERFARLVLTNCDAFDQFPPAPFSLIHVLRRIPGAVPLTLRSMRFSVSQRLGFGALFGSAYPGELVREWSRPVVDSAAIRRDTQRFIAGIRPAELLAVSQRLDRYPGPVLLAWAPADRFFKIAFAERLRDAFTDARIVEIADAKTFVPWDQPVRVADEIRRFAAATADPAGSASRNGNQPAAVSAVAGAVTAGSHVEG